MNRLIPGCMLVPGLYISLPPSQADDRATLVDQRFRARWGLMP